MRIRYWLWSIGVVVVFALGFAGYWGYENWIHATPKKTIAMQKGVVPVRAIPFAHGTFVFSTIGNTFLQATYLRKGFWGWHEVITGATVFQTPQKSKAEFGTDVASMVVDNKTLVWGTFMNPKEIIEHHNGKVFRTTIKRNGMVWYIVLPFKQHYFPYSEWTMVLPNGKTTSLFKQS